MIRTNFLCRFVSSVVPAIVSWIVVGFGGFSDGELQSISSTSDGLLSNPANAGPVSKAVEIDLGFPVRGFDLSDEQDIGVFWGRVSNSTSNSERVVAVDLELGKLLHSREIIGGIEHALVERGSLYIRPRSAWRERITLKFRCDALDAEPDILTTSELKAGADRSFVANSLNLRHPTKYSEQLWTDGATVRSSKTGDIVAIRSREGFEFLAGYRNYLKSQTPKKSSTVPLQLPKEMKLHARHHDTRGATRFAIARQMDQKLHYDFWLIGFDESGHRILGKEFLIHLGQGERSYAERSYKNLIQSSVRHVVCCFSSRVFVLPRSRFESQPEPLSIAWPRMSVLEMDRKYSIQLKVKGGSGNYSFRTVKLPFGTVLTDSGILMVNTDELVIEELPRQQSSSSQKVWNEESALRFESLTGVRFPDGKLPACTPITLEVSDDQNRLLSVTFYLIVAADMKQNESQTRFSASKSSGKLDSRIQNVERRLQNLNDKLKKIEGALSAGKKEKSNSN